MSARLLSNIHNLVTWNLGQNYYFDGCMQYLMECLGADKEYDYWFFSGVTGDSFTQLYRANYTEFTSCLSQDTFDHELAGRAFDACGYGFTYVTGPELQADRAGWTARVIACLDSGLPVITNGCAGTRDFAVICGYDDGGKTLLYLKGEDRTPTPYTDGLEHSKGLVFAGPRKQAPPLADVYRHTVMNIPAFMTRPPRDGLVFGKPAFEAWAGSFQGDTFQGKADAELDVWKIHGTYLCIAGTNGCARGFLEKALALCPDMAIIPELQPIYERMQTLFEIVSRMEGGFNITAAKLKDKAAMRPIAARIREFSRCCDEILAVFAREQDR